MGLTFGIVAELLADQIRGFFAHQPITRQLTPGNGKNSFDALNFLMVLCTFPLFIATGLLIWMPETGVLFWMVHVGMALIATPLMFGHIFMALVNPGTRVGLSGMISGYVDRHWAKHHYGLWYRESFEDNARESAEDRKTIDPRRRNGFVVLRFGAQGEAGGREAYTGGEGRGSRCRACRHTRGKAGRMRGVPWTSREYCG
jgi:hypothetical protein